MTRMDRYSRCARSTVATKFRPAITSIYRVQYMAIHNKSPTSAAAKQPAAAPLQVFECVKRCALSQIRYSRGRGVRMVKIPSLDRFQA